jgi:hypothetical protein
MINKAVEQFCIILQGQFKSMASRVMLVQDPTRRRAELVAKLS